MKRGFMRHALHIPRTPAYPVPFHKKQKYQRLKQEIYDNLKRLAAEGIGIIICSSETEELLSSSDRIMIMKEGKIVKELITAKTSSEEILQYSIAE